MFTENKISIFSQVVIYTFLGAAFVLSLKNLYNGVVPNPESFWIVLLGFVFFLAAKIHLILKGIRFSFGTKLMKQGWANSYRCGYWLMIVGFLGTFFSYGI